MSARLEHANLSVRDLDEMLRFLTIAFPEFRVRGKGNNTDGTRWVHIGTDETYLAVNQSSLAVNQSSREPGEAWDPSQRLPGVNHLAFEVDDVEAVRSRLAAAGYEDSTVHNAHPHRRRVYFYDREGNDWEFVEYLSDDPLERHDYTLPDR